MGLTSALHWGLSLTHAARLGEGEALGEGGSVGGARALRLHQNQPPEIHEHDCYEEQLKGQEKESYFEGCFSGIAGHIMHLAGGGYAGGARGARALLLRRNQAPPMPRNS